MRIRVKGPRHAIMPRDAVFDRALRQRDKLVLLAICSFSNRDRESWPSQETLAEALVEGDEDASAAVRSVKRAVAALRERGWLQVTKDGRLNVYEVAVAPGRFMSEIEKPQQGTLATPIADGIGDTRGTGQGTRNGVDRGHAGSALKRTDQGTDQGTGAALSATALSELAGRLTDRLWDSLVKYLGGKPTTFSYPAARKAIAKALTDGDTEAQVAKACDLWLETRPQPTVASFLAQFDIHRRHARGGAPAGTKPKSAMDRLRHGETDESRHDPAAWGGA